MAGRQAQQAPTETVSDQAQPGVLSVEERGKRLAESHQAVREPGHIGWLTARLKAQEKFLTIVYKRFASGTSQEPVQSYAAEWMLDNFYIVQQAIREIQEDMPAGFYRRLPKLKGTGKERAPRVYAVAHEILHVCGGHIQTETVVQFMQAYQRVEPFLIGEVWALPAMLRIMVVEFLTAALAQITQLPFEAEPPLFAIVPLPADIQDESIVANSILSLRTIANEDWKAFFERISLVEHSLRHDPLQTYAAMDFETRDMYRKQIEQIALAAGSREVDVAREVVQLAEAAADADAPPRETHIGYYLLDKAKPDLGRRLNYHPGLFSRIGRWILRHPPAVYLSGILFLTAGFLVALVLYAAAIGVPAIQVVVMCLLYVILASRTATGIINWALTHILRPRILPKLDFQSGIAPEFRTIVIIPTLLADPDEIRMLLGQIERHYLGNTDPYISFALLGDFADAPQKHMPDDDVLIAQAVRGIQELNARYARASAGPFYLFNREREWNPSEGVWMCWERKRGNLQQFNHFLLGKQSSYRIQIGDLGALTHIRFVITLDADTVLPRDSARRLIATLAHPLNQPQIDASGKVSAGYTVLQPRTEVKPTSANRSPFTRIYAGDIGLDLYTRAVSDVYQDFFGEGIYVGKGIYDLAAFDGCLDKKLPQNAVLSHDLLEGLHGRVALVTDVTLLEEYPPNYLSYMHRLHRWVRGDWQLLPWLFSGKVFNADKETELATLSPISRWKIIDNLVRSLLSTALFLLLVLSWFWLYGSSLVWTLIFILTPTAPVAIALSIQWMHDRTARLTFTRTLRWLLVLVFLPFEAFVMINAISLTLFRLAVSRKNLLQWTTAAHALRIFGKDKMMLMFWQQMLVAPLAAVAIGVPLGVFYISNFTVAAPLLFLWLFSPQAAYWISRPYQRKKERLTDEQRRRLREIARRTWLFFEQFVGPEDHWLPPDHFQESPRGLVAHRTSITNIGLMLASVAVAHDLGYISSLDYISRLRNAFESMDLLERHRGHFLNWYDTRTLEPLPPRYVSTVDSGNLAASLIALKEALRNFPNVSVLPSERWQGLADTAAVLEQSMRNLRHVSPDSIAPVQEYLSQFQKQIEDIRQAETCRQAQSLVDLYERRRLELEERLAGFISENQHNLEAASVNALRTWSERIRHHVYDMRREMEVLAPWLLLLHDAPTIFADARYSTALEFQRIEQSLERELVMHQIGPLAHEVRKQIEQVRSRLKEMQVPDDKCREANEWLDNLETSFLSGEENARRLLDDYQDLILKAEMYVRDMQFGFLFDQQREIFYIGYNVDYEQLDNNRYDLLASEARLASLVAIAKGDVSQSHWLHLSRPFASIDGICGLMSWAGTMFEYLMPGLLVRQYESSLLDQSNRAAVNLQIEYCRKKNVPWGVSESGYYRFDVNLNYQYRAFGVPGLGFKRGLSEDLVVAPYACLLALPVSPRKVAQNAEHLVNLKMLGLYGFYEAVDYTPSRLILGRERSIVQSYMSHHQSMILLSLANYFFDDIMIRRFHADPAIQSVELLLQEQIPVRAPLEELPTEEAAAALVVHPPTTATPWQIPVQSPFPQAYFLSNGSYGVLITGSGSGYSCWKDIAVTRWRADTTLDDWGMWIYVQDLDAEQFASIGYQPTASLPQEREVSFYPHKADFRCKMDDIVVHMEITVPPEEDGEIRRLTFTNQSAWPRRLSVTSYGEVVLSAQETDQRHQAFNKMFIESSFLPDLNGLLFRRRLQSPEEAPVHLVHTLVLESGKGAVGIHESDRQRFIGRGGSISKPAAIRPEGPMLSNTTGVTLDPVMALSQEIMVEPHSSSRVAFVSVIDARKRQALALAERYQEWAVIDRAFEMARAQSELELRQQKLTIPDLERFQQVLSLLMYPHPSLRAEPAVIAANTRGQPSLWPFSISGDYPLLLIRIGAEEEISLVSELLKAHTYWRNRRLKIDLVILNTRETGYSQELQNHLHRLLSQTNNDTWVNQRGGIFILRADQISEPERTLLETAARVILDGDKGSFALQLEKLQRGPTYLPIFAPAPPPQAVRPVPPVERPLDLLFDNGIGGFSRDGKEYIIYIAPGRRTPLPWINVISNPDFGFFISESGGGCTWSLNSGENRLTPWSNDPVLDRPGEALYLRDEEIAEIWTPTPLPAGTGLPYLVRHGAGYSVFEHRSHELRQTLTVYAAVHAPLKIIHLHLENLSNRTRRITVTYYAEWVLGNTRELMQQYIVPEYQLEAHALFAYNPYNADFAGRAAFLAVNKEPFGITADRTEFLGRTGDYRTPAALRRIGLSGAISAGMDPCAAVQLHIDLHPNESTEEYFLLGQEADRQSALDLIGEYQDPTRVEAELTEVKQYWDDVLGRATVDTPDPAMNLLLNRWLPYQNLSCRLWGRTAFYQSSGAYGYRDQLQDVMALTHLMPEAARSHILRAARHQFEAGDVLHWWHPPAGKGVRTRTSDDLLWLPYVTAQYILETGDTDILHEQVPFLIGSPLKPEEPERYGQYPPTRETYSLYEHCRRSIQKGSTSGAHGLPLMGTGDWNDGMNLVGAKGFGESIWLGWFLCSVLDAFIPLCKSFGDEGNASRYLRQLERLKEVLEANAWDGRWYLRAYHDDGSPIGSSQSLECQIDSIAQSWAVLSKSGNLERARTAMYSLLSRLVKTRDKLVLLFAPPFDRTPHEPGYIKGYPPGVRENGGQYTHAAVWAAWAFAMMGEGDRAEALFRLLNPIYHANSLENAERYQGEPYVVAADVYGMPPLIGRGGWTWYTGSAGWMYRLGIEAILGLKRRGKMLEIDPSIPKTWPRYAITWRAGTALYCIHVDNRESVNQGVEYIEMDGERLPDNKIPLTDDSRRHEIIVIMGRGKRVAFAGSIE
jgi:cyclic beta-1,2-glucan synthetase